MSPSGPETPVRRGDGATFEDPRSPNAIALTRTPLHARPAPKGDLNTAAAMDPRSPNAISLQRTPLHHQTHMSGVAISDENSSPNLYREQQARSHPKQHFVDPRSPGSRTPLPAAHTPQTHTAQASVFVDPRSPGSRTPLVHNAYTQHAFVDPRSPGLRTPLAPAEHKASKQEDSIDSFVRTRHGVRGGRGARTSDQQLLEMLANKHQETFE
eukprot:CAMPEP_0177653036 /NCGR_PEP_ID=MMETSP0447-20121125/13494_1 /TAXON_ID=0 /ORGANISM="Stygamoeba regulata, Strain BSH-02190019" /LENGTH=211 /DNA_ID=CAMNT_0019156411 /DNA_START=49 /DNA_END=684 /DNA_ORIENTATION=+